MTDEHEDEKEVAFEPLQSEIDDSKTTPATFDIITYPADWTLEGLITKYRKRNIIVPGFQRKFVWNINQASRLIESFLLGLPVPSIFLYLEPSTSIHLVIDGQQRILSIAYYMEGLFGEQVKGKRTVFKLKGLNKESPYRDKTYQDLQETDKAAFNRLNDAVLRAFIVKQLSPKGHTSIYHIFERLNTGGTQLVGQEIRNCVFHGQFNDLLWELNCDDKWREIFGKPDPDKRQRDRELILRFLALYYQGSAYSKPMKAFLSEFMSSNRKGERFPLDQCRTLFVSTAEAVHSHLGPKPFHIRAGLNAAMFDCVFVAFAKHIGSIPQDVSDRYSSLESDPDLHTFISSATTDEDVVKGRLERAERVLFG